VGLLLFRLILDRPRTYGLPSIAEREGEPATPDRLRLGRRQLDALRSPAVWLLGLASASLYVTRFGMNSWLMLYLQEVKGYGDVDAGITTSILPIVGVAGTVLSGTVSDVLFRSRRVPVLLLYGVLLVAALVGLYLVPPGNPWLDRVLVGGIGFAIGGLLVFLGGLMAVDICPREATGAVMGFIGLFSYLGAALQDWITGLLLESQKTVVGGVAHYGFDRAYLFWVAAAVVSLALAASLGAVRRFAAPQPGPAAPSR
jgi:OPA family sugar phosphate sensor protein UhpC-like MFS transporter